jgi:hypothetical protein
VYVLVGHRRHFSAHSLERLLDMDKGKIKPLLSYTGIKRTSNRAKEAARLDLDVSAGWASRSSRGLRGGDTLLLSSTVSSSLDT